MALNQQYPLLCSFYRCRIGIMYMYISFELLLLLLFYYAHTSRPQHLIGKTVDPICRHLVQGRGNKARHNTLQFLPIFFYYLQVYLQFKWLRRSKVTILLTAARDTQAVCSRTTGVMLTSCNEFFWILFDFPYLSIGLVADKGINLGSCVFIHFAIIKLYSWIDCVYHPIGNMLHIWWCIWKPNQAVNMRTTSVAIQSASSNQQHQAHLRKMP